MKSLLSTLLIFFLVFPFSGCRSVNTAEDTVEQPNIILILTDDQRVETMEYMPAIMEREGMTFTNAYVTTPLCCPSRTSILTGQYAHNHGVLDNRLPEGGFNKFKDSRDDLTLATYLQDIGYRTALIGKYLNDYGDDVKEGEGVYIPEGWDWFYAVYGKPGFYDYKLTSYTEETSAKVLTYGKGPEDYSTDVLTNFAVDFIKDSSEPFFLYYAPFAPHTPSTPAPEYEGTQKNLEWQGEAFNESDVSDKTGWTAGLPLLTTVQEKKVDDSYEKTVESLLSVDDAFALFLDTLEEEGKLENTYIVFMSDNGVEMGEHRILNGKSTPYEEAVHVPLKVFGPDVPSGASDEMVLNIDLVSTFLEMAGGQALPGIDGKSFYSLIQGEAGFTRDDFLIESWNDENTIPFVALHQKEWVYIEFEDGHQELYNLSEDPYELNNLAQESTYADRLNEMVNRLKKLVECAGNACS